MESCVLKIAIIDNVDGANLHVILSSNTIYKPDALKKGSRYFGKILKVKSTQS
jgi:hypothetical protein